MKRIAPVLLLLLATPALAQRATLWGGVSLPTGDYGSNTGADAGWADTGWLVGLDLGVPLAQHFEGGLSFQYRTHAISAALEREVSRQLGAGVEIGRDKTPAVLAGLHYVRGISEGALLRLSGGLGLVAYNPPPLTLVFTHPGGIEMETASGEWNAGLAYELGAAVQFSRVLVGVRYLHAPPVAAEYDVIGDPYEQPLSMVAIVLGIVLN